MRPKKRQKKYFKFIINLCFFTMVLFVPSLMAREFNGFKLEYMNAQKINYYGFGLFTSDKRFDAEMEFFLAQKLFSGSGEPEEEENQDPQDPPSITEDYRLWFMSFAAYFHFIRTDKLSFYVGSGIMPLLPQAYSYHWTVGMSFFWSDHFRVFYTYRHLYNNAGQRYSFPNGPALSFGLKYSFDFLSSGG